VVADGSPHEVMGDRELMEAHGLEKPHSLIPHRSQHHSEGSSL
jgi:cobalt/nickel transport system ATP-binding protein